MEKQIKITKAKLRLFHILGREYLAKAVQKPDNGSPATAQINGSAPTTKLHYAIQKVLRQTQPLNVQFAEELEEVKIMKYYDRDAAGYLIPGQDKGTFKMKPEQEVKYRKEAKIAGEAQVAIDPYVITDYDRLFFERNYDLMEAFSGIVIPNMEEKVEKSGNGKVMEANGREEKRGKNIE